MRKSEREVAWKPHKVYKMFTQEMHLWLRSNDYFFQVFPFLLLSFKLDIILYMNYYSRFSTNVKTL